MMAVLARLCGAGGAASMLDRVLPDLNPDARCQYHDNQPPPLVEWPPPVGHHFCVGEGSCDVCGVAV